jgi:chromosome segregation ATPase
LILV